MKHIFSGFIFYFYSFIHWFIPLYILLLFWNLINLWQNEQFSPRFIKKLCSYRFVLRFKLFDFRFVFILALVFLYYRFRFKFPYEPIAKSYHCNSPYYKIYTRKKCGAEVLGLKHVTKIQLKYPVEVQQMSKSCRCPSFINPYIYIWNISSVDLFLFKVIYLSIHLFHYIFRYFS